MDFDFFTIARPSAELAYESVLIKAEFISKLAKSFYDNDASHPNNSLFVGHGDSKLLKGVDPSSLIGTLHVDQNSQHQMNLFLKLHLPTKGILANANFHFAQEATLNNILEFSLSETYAPKQIRDEFAAVRPLCVWGRVKR